MKKILILLALMALSISALGGCGGTGAGSADVPPGENPGVPSVVQLSPSHFIAQTNASITLHAKVLDGNGVPVQNVPVTFTNLSEPFGVISSALKSLGIIKPKVILSTTVKNTDINGIATVSIISTIGGFATIQAEVNSGTGLVRDKKTVLFSSTFNLPSFAFAPQLFLDVDTNASFTSPDEPNDFILFKTTDDNKRYIRATVLFDSSISGKVITFGSDSTDVTVCLPASPPTLPPTCLSGGVSGQEIDVVADSNGQAIVLATVNPSALSQVTKTINITAAAADGASNILTLFLEPVVIAPPPASSLSASPTTVEVNGTSQITATVNLAIGGPVPDGTAVNFTATCGAVDAFAQTTGGIALATFTAPATVPSGGICTVSGKVAGVSIGSVPITIVPALAVSPGSQTVNGVTGNPSVTYTISGGVTPYSVSSSDLTLPAVLTSPTFTINVPAGTSARTVTYTVTDFAGSSVAASLVITGPSSLIVLPGSVTIASGAAQTVTFTIAGGTPPYITTSTDPTKACNSTDADCIDPADSGIWNAANTGTANGTPIAVKIPAAVSAGTVTLNVFDSIGGTTSATITIIGGGAGPGTGLAVTPTSVSLTGLHNPDGSAADNVLFTITGGSPDYSMFSDNGAVISSAGALGAGITTFTVDPDSVAASTAVTLTVIDSVGAIAKATVTVTPATSSLAINPSTIAVSGSVPITFNIIGGLPPYKVYTSNTGVVGLGGNPITIPPGTNPFIANTTGASGAATITVVDADNKTVTAAVTVATSSPDFTISCTSPGSISIAAVTGNSVCTVTSLNGYSIADTLSCSGLPIGVTCNSFTPNPVTPPAGGTAASALVIGVGGAVPGAASFNVVASDGTLSHVSTINFTIAP